MMRRRSLSLALATLLTISLSACGGGSDPIITPPAGAGALSKITVAAPTVSAAAGASSTIAATGFDAANTGLSGVTYTYVSSSTSVAEVSAAGSVLALRAGTSNITVTGTLSGVSKTATVVVTVTGALPTTAAVVGGSGGNVFAPNSVVIATGGSVGWTWGANNHNVTFATATGAPAGIATGGNVTASRVFATAGDFAYECTLHAGMTAKVTVR